MTLKIAISLTGFIRTWEYTKRSFVEQLMKDPNVEIDVFVHTYHQNMYEFSSGKQDVFLTRGEIEKLLEGIPVKSLIIEDRDKILPIVSKASHKYDYTENFYASQLESSDKSSISIPIGCRTYDHLRKLHLSNEQIKTYSKEHNIKYDLIVKTRFDIVYFNVPEWENFTDDALHTDFGSTFGYPCDTVGVGSPQIMNKYLDRFLEFPEMFNPDEMKVAGICSHATLRYILEKYHIPIGSPVVNTLCFRSDTSVQYGGNYRYRCDLNWIYNILTKLNLSDVHAIEAEKHRIMSF
jgi:hypothetical protein